MGLCRAPAEDRMLQQECTYDDVLRSEFQTVLRAWAAMPENETRKAIDIDSLASGACVEPTFKKTRNKKGTVSEIVCFPYTIDITPIIWEKVILPWGFFNEARVVTIEAPPPPSPSYRPTQLPVSLMIHEDLVELLNAVDEQLLSTSSLGGESVLSVQEDGDKFIMDAQMVFAGSRQTYMSIASDEGYISGCGWDVIAPFMYPFQNLRSSKSKMSISPTGVWSRDNKKGVTWRVDCILLLPGPEREEEEWEDPLMFTD